MLNIFFWIVLIFPLFFYPKTDSFFSLDVFIISTVVFACIEFSLFFGSSWTEKIRSYSNQITCKFPSLAKVAAENEDKIRKIRLIAFILFAIITFIIISLIKPAKLVDIIVFSYSIFVLYINSDIAYALASADDRKLFWQEYINTRRVVIAIILACAFHALMLYRG